MAIRLTESRLRQIIREEASNLRSQGKRRRLRESHEEAFEAAWESGEYPGLVDELYSAFPQVEAAMKQFCADGDPTNARAYLQKYFPMMGVESEDEWRVLDEIGNRCGVKEFSMVDDFHYYDDDI